MNLTDIAEILQAVLALVGALKVLSRYTPWKWDDAIFNLFDHKDDVK